MQIDAGASEASAQKNYYGHQRCCAKNFIYDKKKEPDFETPDAVGIAAEIPDPPRRGGIVAESPVF